MVEYSGLSSGFYYNKKSIRQSYVRTIIKVLLRESGLSIPM